MAIPKNFASEQSIEKPAHINILEIKQEVNIELNSQYFLLVLKFEGIHSLPFLEKTKKS